MSDADVIVIGGGLVGSAIAWGLGRAGARALVLDEGDVAFRASRGNFGLVWVQGKGRGCPEYAQWTRLSADLWPEFAALLQAQTGIDVGHERPGGVMLSLTEAEHRATRELLEAIAREAGNQPYDTRFLERAELRDLLPGVGAHVVSASYSPYDGHANPLYLLRALHAGIAAFGGRYLANHKVLEIAAGDKGVTVTTAAGTYRAPKAVIAAGLATQELAHKVGLKAPIEPSHGQIMVTERTPYRVPLPTNLVRQTREGAMMLGYTVDDFGFDVRTRVDRSRNVAAGALKAFPFLADLRVVRTWAALRVMTADGLPIYDRSPSHPGVAIAACHSGVTLAAVHALEVAPWVQGAPMPASFERFSTRRFHVQAAA